MLISAVYTKDKTIAPALSWSESYPFSTFDADKCLAVRLSAAFLHFLSDPKSNLMQITSPVCLIVV